MEKGCLNYHCYQDVEEKNGFVIVEQWQTQQDLAFDLGGVDVTDAPAGMISQVKIDLDLPSPAARRSQRVRRRSASR